MSAWLSEFEAVASDDMVKTDLELTCMRCGNVICDIEHSDRLDVLVRLAEDHWKGEGHELPQ